MRNLSRALLALITALLLLTASRAFSQTISIPVGQAAKIADSLRVLPLVRQEAAAWRAAAVGYRSAADSLRVADAGHRAAYQSEQVATAKWAQLYDNEATVAAGWKAKARKRGLLNYLLLAGIGGTAYLFTR